jgi:hypothetical protein
MLARLRAMDPYRADLLLAALLAVEGQIEVLLLVPDGSGSDGLVALLMLGLAACVAIRRRLPVVAALAGLALFCVYPALGQEYVDNLISPFFITLLVIYGIGRHLEGVAVWAVTAYAAGLMALFTAIEGTDDAIGNYLLSIGALVVAPASAA